MKKFLLTWELGGGYGHLASLRSLAEALVKLGASVTLSARDLSKVEQVFAGLPVTLLQSPVSNVAAVARIPVITCYADLLHNCGFGSADSLLTAALAWRELFERVAPDCVVVDHSPTALLASRGEAIQRVIMSDGFSWPANSQPLPSFRQIKSNGAWRDAEARVLANANQVLSALAAPLLPRLSDLYHDGIAAAALTTYSEIDPFGARPGVRYLGAVEMDFGEEVTWPEGSGPRVFAYLKRFDGVATVLNTLLKWRARAIVSINAPGDVQIKLPPAHSLRIINGPVRLASLMADCDLAILNGGNGTSARALKAGAPMLQIPLTMEQYLVASRCVGMGAARLAPPSDSNAITRELDEALAQREALAQNSRLFQHRYATFEPNTRMEQFAAHLTKDGKGEKA